MSLSAILITTFLIQQPQPASIEGTVVQIGTMQPIARAVVQVIGDKSALYTMETGVDGKFQFQNLPRGQYQIRVSRTGCMDGVFGQRGPNGRGRSGRCRSDNKGYSRRNGSVWHHLRPGV